MSHRTLAERTEIGREARRALPLEAHAELTPPTDRPDTVAVLRAQNELRLPWLVPVRHHRMQPSLLTFYRGTAQLMATDLGAGPNSGLDVQLIGDGHLSNFGVYASPERTLVFDANDFDETRTGPWEWDVKRLATSFLLAARHQGFSAGDAEAVTATVVATYREAMARFAGMGFLDLWYDHTGIDDLHRLADDEPDALDRWVDDLARKAMRRDSLQALEKLAEYQEGSHRIRADRPYLVPIRDVLPEYEPDELDRVVREAFDRYLATLRDDRRNLLSRYRLVDVALKVVGVGSVGTRCFILLLEGRDEHDPLILQAKEATPSVLEGELGPSRYAHQGQRVVEGQRQIQAQSDIFLGWTTGDQGRHFYFRQLRDWKGAFNVEKADPQGLRFYARMCGYILARGHARSGDPVAIATYLGDGDGFDRALLAFTDRYADQTATDYRAFLDGIERGELPVMEESDPSA